MLGVLHRNAPVVATFHSYFAREHFEGRVYTAMRAAAASGVAQGRPAPGREHARPAFRVLAMGDDPWRSCLTVRRRHLASATPATLPPGDASLRWPARATQGISRRLARVREAGTGVPGTFSWWSSATASSATRSMTLPDDVRAAVHMMGRVSYEALRPTTRQRTF